MAKASVPREADGSLAIRAAWLHYTGGLTQAEVAARLGVSPVKAHRLVAEATRRGAVRISIEGPVAECIELEARLCAAFGLSEARVAVDLSEVGLPLKALGLEGARFLEQALCAPNALVGIGHGRTLGAAVAALPRSDLGRARVVALMGGLTRNYAATPHDVMYKLTERTGVTAHVMPVPFLANSPEDRSLLLAQRGVDQVSRMWAEASVLFAGVGTVQPDAQLVDAGMISPEEIDEVKRSGAVGELLGHFFDETGRSVETALSARTVSPRLEDLRSRRIVALAGGAGKVPALRAVLRGGLLGGLITDERTARAVLEDS